MTLSRTKIFEQNLELTKQRLFKELESPESFTWIPHNARIINLPKDSPELLQANLNLALELASGQDQRPIVLIPEAGFEMPWSELLPVVSGKRIVDIQSVQGGAGFDLTFDDGSQLMFVATKQRASPEGEQLVISIGMHKETVP